MMQTQQWWQTEQQARQTALTVPQQLILWPWEGATAAAGL